jgi:hypothetical protein
VGGADPPCGDARGEERAGPSRAAGLARDGTAGGLGGARAGHDPRQSPVGSLTATARVCGLCGTALAIVIPPGDQETARDRLCAECAFLPAPPTGPDDAGAA